MKTVGERIRYLRNEVLGLTQGALAKKLDVSRQAVTQWEGGAQIATENLLGIAALANASVDWIARGEGPQPLPQPLSLEQFTRASREYLTPTNPNGLPVFAAVEGGEGEMVVSAEEIDVVDTPWFLSRVKESYAVLVIGESMSPAYEPGDMAFVNPKLPPRRGKDAIFVSPLHGDFKAIIKRFVSSTPESYIVEQFNPAKQLTLPRRLWTGVYRVVGKYSGA